MSASDPASADRTILVALCCFTPIPMILPGVSFDRRR